MMPDEKKTRGTTRTRLVRKIIDLSDDGVPGFATRWNGAGTLRGIADYYAITEYDVGQLARDLGLGARPRRSRHDGDDGPTAGEIAAALMEAGLPDQLAQLLWEKVNTDAEQLAARAGFTVPTE